MTITALRCIYNKTWILVDNIFIASLHYQFPSSSDGNFYLLYGKYNCVAGCLMQQVLKITIIMQILIF